MAKLSYAELKASVASYVKANKISVDTFEITRDNTAGLLDKIGKIVTIDTSYIDKLAIFDGEELSFGKTIEEWQEDLILPQDYDGTGAGALSPHDGTYRPVAYSYTLGRKKIPQTIRDNDLERAVHNIGQYIELISMKSKRIFDSYAMYRYQVKRQMLAVLAEMCEKATASAGATYAGETFANNKDYAVNSLVRSASSGQNIQYGIVVKPIKSGDFSTFALAVAGGAVVVYDSLVETISVPSDAESGEAFITAVKKAVEQSQDLSEGHSLNGNTLGSAEAGMVLVVKQGVMPEIETKVLAGAFHSDKVAIPAEVVRVKDFGSDTSGVFAILVDRRGIRLHNTHLAVRENYNGDGEFLNLFHHSEHTAFISRNTFVKVYVAQSE